MKPDPNKKHPIPGYEKEIYRGVVEYIPAKKGNI